MNRQNHDPNQKAYNAANRTVAAAIAILVGSAGINHGFFEILQGNVAPEGLLFAAIGLQQRFWIHGQHTALTIIPNLLITGILSVLIGIAVIIWALKHIHRKNGPLILMLFCFLLFLEGSGFAPIFMALFASLNATRIHKPLTLWHRLFSGALGRYLSPIWLVLLVVYLLLLTFSVEIAIFGWPLTAFYDPDTTFNLLNNIAFTILGLMFLSILAGFARDIQENPGFPHQHPATTS